VSILIFAVTQKSNDIEFFQGGLQVTVQFDRLKAF